MTSAVIIAAFKAERWIGECLASWEAVEIPEGWTLDLRIGVDGCESTAKELDRLGVPYRYSPENVGPYLIRNALIEESRADAYVIFDADDLADPGYLEALLPLAGTEGIAGAARRTLEGDRIISPRFGYANGVCVISGNAWTKLGGYRPWRMAADHDLIQRARALKVRVQKHPDPIYTRRRHPDSLTRRTDTGLRSKARRDLKRKSARMIALSRKPEDLRVTPQIAEFTAHAAA